MLSSFILPRLFENLNVTLFLPWIRKEDIMSFVTMQIKVNGGKVVWIPAEESTEWLKLYFQALINKKINVASAL